MSPSSRVVPLRQQRQRWLARSTALSAHKRIARSKFATRWVLPSTAPSAGSSKAAASKTAPLVVRVLLVDDSRTTRLLLTALLRKAAKALGANIACECSEVQTAEEAIAFLGAHEHGSEAFDLVVTDEDMEPAGGKLKGSELPQQLRGRRLLSPNTLLVSHSSVHSEGASLDRFLSAGFVDVWPKPFQNLAKIEACLRLVAARLSRANDVAQVLSPQ